MNETREYRIAILGPGGVGKSCLTVRFVNDSFDEVYDPTVQDSYRKSDTVEGVGDAVFEITDTAGQEDFYAMVDQSMRENEGFILVFALNLRATFDELEKSFIDKFEKVKGDLRKVPLVLVGNKCDLEEERVVTTEEAEARARAWCCEFMECSAKTNIKVTEAFHECVKQIRKYEEGGDDPNAPGKAASSTGGDNAGCCLIL